MKGALPPNMDSMILSRINISPFSYHSIDNIDNDVKNIDTYKDDLRRYLGKDYVLTESGRHGIELVLAELCLTSNDVVTIFPSLGTNYVSSCVTKTIDKYCKWSMKIEVNTKAVFVIHEWGIPHSEMKNICDLGFPVIEDCAYSFSSTDNCGLVGNHGKYSIYSLPKFFEINFGGIVSGLCCHDDVLSTEHIEYIYRNVGPQLKKVPNIVSKRIENWNILKTLFESVGVQPFFCLKDGIVPGVFMFCPDVNLNLEDIKTRYNSYGVESTIYYGSNAFYIPCNQSINRGILEFLFNIYVTLL